MNHSHNPYVGPRAIQEGETLYGRNHEIRALLLALIAERIVLLQAPSGAGKTSLVQAGIIPELRHRNFDVLPIIRVNMEPPANIHLGEQFNRYIYSTLLSLEEGLPPETRRPVEELAVLTLDQYLNQRPHSAEGNISSVLIFDQFEEILTASPFDRNSKEQFFAQLGAALRNDSRWALFAIRDDYLGAMQPYQRPIPNRFNTVFRMEQLGPDAARDAIQNPARNHGVGFTDAAAQQLVDDLRATLWQMPDGSAVMQLAEYVEPMHLQVVCYQLWQNHPEESTTISEADLATAGNVNEAIANYYASCVTAAAQRSGVAERQIRDWVGQKLITPQGLRSEVLRRPSSSDGLDNQVISLLQNAHLVRGKIRGGATWYELSHDRLVAPIRVSNAQWAAQNLRLFQHQAILWDEFGRRESLLLHDDEFQQAEREAKELFLTPSEHAFLQACRAARKRR